MLDELQAEMPCYIDYLEYKYTYPNSAITVLDKEGNHLHIELSLKPMEFDKWKELFFY